MWVTSSGIPRDTLWTHRTAGMKWAFLNWLLQSQQDSNHRFVCGECWTFSPIISPATLKYKKRCNMGFLIQSTFPSNLQWALLINSSSSRSLEIKGWEHWPCKNRIQNVSHSTDGAVWSLVKWLSWRNSPQRKHAAAVAELSTCHRSAETDPGVNSSE